MKESEFEEYRQENPFLDPTVNLERMTSQELRDYRQGCQEALERINGLEEHYKAQFGLERMTQQALNAHLEYLTYLRESEMVTKVI